MDKIIRKLNLYINSKEISAEEQECFSSFLNHLKSSRKVCFISRGDGNLEKHYGTSLDNIPLLIQNIFVLGEKGRSFLEGHMSYGNVFQILWDKFNEKVCGLKFGKPNSLKHVSTFLKENPSIKNYFSDNTNRDSFVNLSELPDKEKGAIADYYFAILHTIGKSVFPKSYFLSTSKKQNVAEKFANKGEGIILYGWAPRRGLKKNILKSIDLEEKCKIVERHSLPTCKSSVYPDQKEICLKCGLLPHFIIGFQHQNKFYINPATLNTWNDNILYDGMRIDQTKFKDFFNASNYSSSFVFIDGTYYIISNNDVRNI